MLCRAHGYRFNHAAFVASHRSSKTRRFLEQLRQSQCYEVFINERLLLASQAYITADPFEAKACPLMPCSSVPCLFTQHGQE